MLTNPTLVIPGLLDIQLEIYAGRSDLEEEIKVEEKFGKIKESPRTTEQYLVGFKQPETTQEDEGQCHHS